MMDGLRGCGGESTILLQFPAPIHSGQAHATSIVAHGYQWIGDLRLIIPIGDEAPCKGDNCVAADADSIANAIAWASELGVDVLPITGHGSPNCARNHADDLAQGTIGTAAIHRNNFSNYATVGVALMNAVDEWDVPCPICIECDHGDCPGDLNDDGWVNVADLLLLFDAWGACADPEDCRADLNCDGVVNVSDLLILFEGWGECPTPITVPQEILDCIDLYDQHGLSAVIKCLDEL
jgi:hypothetical protein